MPVADGCSMRSWRRYSFFSRPLGSPGGLSSMRARAVMSRNARSPSPSAIWIPSEGPSQSSLSTMMWSIFNPSLPSGPMSM